MWRFQACMVHRRTRDGCLPHNNGRLARSARSETAMRQRSDWKLVLAVGLWVAAIAANPKKNRTSPVGYEDTPVLPGQKWRVHDIKRPHPRVVTPGTESSQDHPGRPPSDAIVLFDG